MAYFSALIFGDAFSTGVTDGVGPESPVTPQPRRGIPINAYKQFKYIDRNGNFYHMKQEGLSGYGY